MKIFRLVFFGFFVWFFVFLLNYIFLRLDLQDKITEISLNFLVWILFVPFFLVCSKWFFKAVNPSIVRGIQLALFSILLYMFLESVSGGIVFDLLTGVILLEILALSVYSGFEFDATYSSRKS